jgi:hypothetical protein
MMDYSKDESKRQANASIAGYEYQLWHSVFAWLELGEGETLYLEGIEDFDIQTQPDLIATQVKHTSKRMSLRSPTVIETINRFWELSKTRIHDRVHIRFLTTAQPVREKSAPWDQGFRGIDIWNKSHPGSPHYAKLLQFLADNKKLDSDLRAFLVSAKENEIIDKVIGRILWVTAATDTPQIKRLVMDKLINHGDRYQKPPELSARIADTLFVKVTETAAKPKERSLTRAQFLEIFEEMTTERVSLFNNSVSIPTAQYLSTVAPSIESSQHTVLVKSNTSVPPLPAAIAVRTCYIERMSEVLAQTGILIPDPRISS